MTEDRPSEATRRRRGCAPCCLWVVGGLGLAVLALALWVASDPQVPLRFTSRPPAPSPNGVDDFAAADRMMNGAAGIAALRTVARAPVVPTGAPPAGGPFYTSGAARDAVLLKAAGAIVAADSGALTRVRLGLTHGCQAPAGADLPGGSASLGELLACESAVRAGRGDHAGAFASAADGLLLGAMVTHGGGWEAQLHGGVVQERVRRRAVQEVDHLTEIECRAIAKRVRLAVDAEQPLALTYAYQRNVALSVIGDIDRRPAAAFSLSDRPLPIPRVALGLQDVLGRVPWRAHRSRAIREIDAHYAACERQADLPLARQTPAPEPKSYVASILAGSTRQTLRREMARRARNRLLLCALLIRAHTLAAGGRRPRSMRSLCRARTRPIHSAATRSSTGQWAPTTCSTAWGPT